MPSTASLPACTGPAGSPHLQALPGPHQVCGPAQPPLVVARCRMPASGQNTSLHSLSQEDMWEETAGARKSHTSCTTTSHSLASDREAAPRASCWFQARKRRQ